MFILNGIVGMSVYYFWRMESVKNGLHRSSIMGFDSLKTTEKRIGYWMWRYYKATAFDFFITETFFKRMVFAFVLALLSFPFLLKKLLLFKIMLSALLLGATLFCLELRIQWVHRQIDQSMLSFFSCVNANLIQHDNLIVALNQSTYYIKCPYILKGIVRFNAMIQAGLSPEKAFKGLQNSVTHSYLKYIYINMEQAYLKRGDVVKLMTQLESEYTLIQVEREKRGIELKQHRIYAWGAFGLMGIIGVRIIQTQDYINLFYLNHSFGQVLLVYLAIGITVALMILMMISLKTVD